ncbi:MAG: AEC family transporter [Bryobacterales bacterium]|nr:AEC family transporter [Bryobacterales bacterium]MBV9400663.1 AEC family transporter [Bryobacterales bacterium]
MNLLLSILASDILPVFAIAGAGFLLARFAGVDVKILARVVFYSLLPCLAFRLLVTSTASGPNVIRLMFLAVLIMGAMGIVGCVAGKALRLDSKLLRAFIMIVMFSNGGNYGLPVVRFAFGNEALTYATIFFLTGSVVTYVAGAFFAGSHRKNIAGALEKVWKMPSLYGIGLALIVLAIGRPVPEAIMRPIVLLSDAALPLMILVLGMQLERAVWPAQPRTVLLGVGISLLVAPFVALALTWLVGVTGTARQAAVILSSMPVAVITTIFALEFELAPEFVTSAVFVSTILSPLTLAPLIAYLR